MPLSSIVGQSRVPDVAETQALAESWGLERDWWARQDSNLQPDRYERPALTIELQAPPGGDHTQRAEEINGGSRVTASLTVALLQPDQNGDGDGGHHRRQHDQPTAAARLDVVVGGRRNPSERRPKAPPVVRIPLSAGASHAGAAADSGGAASQHKAGAGDRSSVPDRSASRSTGRSSRRCAPARTGW